MKILFFVYRFWPEVGGVEKYIHQLARALDGMGHAVRILTPAHRPDLPLHETRDGLEIHRFPGYRSPARAGLRLMRLHNLFRWADVIHVSNTHVLEYFYRMVAWTLPDRPVFLTRHGMSYIYPVPESEMARARRSLAWVDGVVHDGCFIEKHLGVAPTIVPDQGLWPEADDLPVIPEPPPDSAVFVGRLDADSGIQTYVDAIACLRDQHRQTITLQVYGGGSLEEHLRRKAERQRLPIVFHGWQPGAQERITDGCFAFVAGRMAMQEAMARRRMVVAAFVDPLKRDYVCGEPFSPHVVAGENARSIAVQVAYYAAHEEERRQHVEAAFAYARRLSWKNTAAAYLQLWSGTGAPQSPRHRLSRLDRIRLALQLRAEARDPDRRPGTHEPLHRCRLPIPAPQ